MGMYEMEFILAISKDFEEVEKYIEIAHKNKIELVYKSPKSLERVLEKYSVNSELTVVFHSSWMSSNSFQELLPIITGDSNIHIHFQIVGKPESYPNLKRSNITISEELPAVFA